MSNKNKQRKGKAITEFSRFERIMARLDYQIKKEKAEEKRSKHEIEQEK